VELGGAKYGIAGSGLAVGLGLGWRCVAAADWSMLGYRLGWDLVSWCVLWG